MPSAAFLRHGLAPAVDNITVALNSPAWRAHIRVWRGPVAPCAGRRRPGADAAEAMMRARAPALHGVPRAEYMPKRPPFGHRMPPRHGALPWRRPRCGPVVRPACPSSPRTRRKNQPRPLRAAPPDRRLKAKPPIAGSGSAPARAPPEIAGLRGGLAAAPAGARQGPNNRGYPNRDVPCFGSAPKS